MKTTLVISLEEDVTQFLDKQGQIDPSAFINQVLRDERQRREADPASYQPASESDQVLESAPSATRIDPNNTLRALEEWSDLNTPAAD
jgi:hypothetical protein